LYGLYSVDQPSVLQQYNLAGGTFYLTDNVVNYLLATNTGDGAKLTVSTNRNDVEGNFRTVIPVVTLPVDNGEIHQMTWAEGGHAMPEKHGNFFINNFRFVRDGLAGGLMIGEASGRAVTLTAGKVWYGGISSINLAAFDSRSGNNFWLYEDKGTGWVRYLTGQYNNTSYQSTSGFATLQNTNRYAVNWVFRTVGDDTRCLSVLGTADYDLTTAQEASVPSKLPPIIPAHAMLVGKIIVGKNATGAYKIYSAFDTAFGGGGVSDHQQLSNLQGGATNEYYHSSSGQYSTWSKITESGGLPLWNGSGWQSSFSPTGYLTSTNTQGAVNQLYTGKQDVLSNSSSLAKITTSTSGCPLWDGGSWPVSISFVESGQYTIASGGNCDRCVYGDVWLTGCRTDLTGFFSSNGSDSLVTVASSAVETIIPNTTITAGNLSGQGVQITGNVHLSHYAPGVTKSSIVRLRRNSISGDVLWSGITADVGDSKLGNQFTLIFGAKDSTPLIQDQIYLLTQTPNTPTTYSVSRYISAFSFANDSQLIPSGSEKNFYIPVPGAKAGDFVLPGFDAPLPFGCIVKQSYAVNNSGCLVLKNFTSSEVVIVNQLSAAIKSKNNN